MSREINKKVVIIADKPSHYRVDFYNLLSMRLQNNLIFYFVMDPRFSRRNVISVFSGELFLKRAIFLKVQKRWARMLHFIYDILRIKPDIIINIGLSMRMLFLVMYSKLLKKRLVVWWSGTKESEIRVSKMKTFYRMFISHYIDGAIFYSKLAKEYLLNMNRKLGKSLIFGNNTLDSSDYFEKVSFLRTKSVSTGNKVINILTVGFLTKEKNIITLIKVFGRIKRKIQNIQLTIVGAGPELNALKEYSRVNNIEDVIFEGFVPYTKIPRFYAKADIYVHPSLLDRWPQTYNEAASSGLPILISNLSGVYDGYIEEYKKYVTFDPRDEEKLQKLLEELIGDKCLREKLGQKALEVALKNDYKIAAWKLFKYFEFFNITIE